MESSLFSLSLKVLTGFCRRWAQKLFICLFLGFVLIFLWIHSQEVPDRPKPIVVQKTIKEEKLIKNIDFIPKPFIYSVVPSSNKGKCSKLKSPSVVPVDTFQPMYDSDKSLYVFSAYYDNRNNKREIRIVGVRTGYLSDRLWCQMWYKDNGKFSLETVQASMSVIPEGSGRLYESVWIVCRSNDLVPSVVSVVSKECTVPSNFLNVNVVNIKKPEKNSFSLCVTPFNLRYDKVDEFIEIMTVNQILGAEHAFFYNYSSSPRIRKITEDMVKEGKATVVQWQLPMKVHVWPVPPGYVEEVKYFGQMAMLQDCLMRGMGRFKYLVYTDMDELAIPRRHNSWHELFETMGYFNRNPAAVMFRNTFFKLEWPSDPVSLKDKDAVEVNSRLILKTKREKTIYNSGARSKYMIDPLQVRTCGVHNIWQMEGGFGGRVEVLSTGDGVLHHYRNWEGLGEKTWVVDRNALRFRNEIVKRMRAAHRRYRNYFSTKSRK